MIILKGNKLIFSSGAGNKRKPNKAGYGYMTKFNNREYIIERSSKNKSIDKNMALDSLIEVFDKTDDFNIPFLLFLNNEYVYNCFINKIKKDKFKDKWNKIDKYVDKIEKQDGKLKFYLLENKPKPTKNKTIKKSYKKFLYKNKDENIKYLKDQSNIHFKKLFRKLLRGMETARINASRGKRRSKA